MSTDTIGGKEAVLSSDLSGNSHKIHGTVIGPDDITRGKSGIEKRWPGEALEKAADTLKGKNLVKNHINDKVEAVIGRVDNVKYRPNAGLMFEASLTDNSIAQQIEDGLLDVSARIEHKDTEELDEDEQGNKIVDRIKRIVNLSVVPDGAAPSNRVDSGPAANLSASELAAAFDYDSESDSEGAQSSSEGKDDVTPSDESESTEDLSDVDELMTVHSVSYSGTSSSGEWSSLAMEDFDTDDLSEIDGHFLASSSGFPPENFGDLSLEVVNENGELTLGGLDSAWKMAAQTDGLSEDQVSTVKTKITNLVQDNFPESDLASRVSDSDEEEAQETEGEELEEEDNESTPDVLDGLSVMSDNEFDDMMEGRTSTDEEENQKTTSIAVHI